VALTRAGTPHHYALTEKKSRVPPFLEDILMEPAIQRRDVLRLAPKPTVFPHGHTAAVTPAATGSLFVSPSRTPKIFSRIAAWADGFCLRLRAAGADPSAGQLPQIAAEISLRPTCGRYRNAKPTLTSELMHGTIAA